MANTIQIKRSNAVAVPVTLAPGELAYSEVVGAKTLYIGTIAGAIEKIGGKRYTDRLDLVTDNEMGYLAGTTSGIQGQLNLKAPITNPTFIGTVTLGQDATAGAQAVTYQQWDGENTNIQDDLALKANIASPTFTGTVTLPSTTSIGLVSATELGYLNGTSSSIQDQLDSIVTNVSNKLDKSLTGDTVVDLNGFTLSFDDGPVEIGTAIKLSSDGVEAVNVKALGSDLNITGTNINVGTTGNTLNVFASDVLIGNATYATDVVLHANSTMALNGVVTYNQTPTAANELVTKGYVDNIAAGLNFKDAAHVASTGNLSLSGLANIDGETIIAGDRILVKDQTDPEDNGIWVAASGAWTRAEDADGTPTNEVSSGMFVFVELGTANGGSAYVLSTHDPITIGTTPLSFSLFSSGNTGTTYTAGTGLSLTGNEFSIANHSASYVTSGTMSGDRISGGTFGGVDAQFITNVQTSALVGAIDGGTF